MATEFGVEFLGIYLFYYDSYILLHYYFILKSIIIYMYFLIIGRVPIDPSLTIMLEKQDSESISAPSSSSPSSSLPPEDDNLIKKYSESNLFKVFIKITDKIIEKANQQEQGINRDQEINRGQEINQEQEIKE